MHIIIYLFIPITGSSLTHSNLVAVLETVEVWELKYCLSVPSSVKKKLQQQYEKDEDYRNELISWWLQSSPYALDSWNWLSGQILSWEEESALAAVMTYVHQTPGKSAVSALATSTILSLQSKA